MIMMLDEIVFDLESPDRETRKRALLMLLNYEDISDPKRIQVLREYLSKEDDEELIAIAKKKYSELAEELNIKLKVSVSENKNLDDLEKIFKTVDLSEKLKLIEELENHKTTASKFSILKILEFENEPDVIIRLLKLFSKEAVEKDAYSIKKFLKHENANVRKAALDALLKIRNPETYSDILAMVADTNEKISRRAIIFIHSWGLKNAIPIMEQWLRLRDKDKIELVLKILEKFPQHETEDLKKQANMALGLITHR